MTHGTDSFGGDMRVERCAEYGQVQVRWPLTRRNCPRASIIIPAAHQRRAMVPFCQFFTLLEWVRAMEIIDSMQLVERKGAGQGRRHT